MSILIKGRRFVDEKNRERIFHGINMVFKGSEREDGSINYIPDWDEANIKWLKSKGFNLIRLGMQWAAIEPEIDRLDQEYLSWLEYMIELCAKHDIHVFLDMHQDLYSSNFGDGAPVWATLDDGLTHYRGGAWSDAYLFSEAVKRAFDNFWHNAPLENGEGIQDHFASLWAKIAKRFKHHENVIGFDIFNEPFPGSGSLEIFGTLLGAYAQLTNKDYSNEELMGLFTDETKKVQMLMDIDNDELYSIMAASTTSLISNFDENVLSSFYSKVCSAIRQVSDKGMIIMENNYFSNMGVQSQIKAIEGEKNQVYAPHGYDLVVDSPAVALSSNQRVDVIFRNHKNVQDRLSVPVIVGEWGAHYSHTEALGHIKHILGLFDQNHWSHTYWDYSPKQETAPVMEVLNRPYPKAVNGVIDEYAYDYDTSVFTLKWDNAGTEEATTVYLPTTPETVTVNAQYTIEDISDLSEACVLKITSDKKGKVELNVKI